MSNRNSESVLDAVISFVGVIVTSVVAVGGIAMLIAVCTAFPVMVLWNAVIPSMFGLSELTFWSALYLSLLCQCLFKASTLSKSDITEAVVKAEEKISAKKFK